MNLFPIRVNLLNLLIILIFHFGETMQSWDREKKETYIQFDCFCEYRDSEIMRDLDKLAGEKNKGIKQIRNWVKKFNWEQRASDFDDLISNIKQGTIKKQITGLGEKQVSQIIEVADSLENMAEAIKEKMQVTADDIDEKKLEALLKLISSYMKSMTDIQKLFQMLRDNPIDSNIKTEKFPFERIIINDEKSYKLAKDLLIRINEVRSSYLKEE